MNVIKIMTNPSIRLIRSRDRFVTRLPWLDSKHSFSFGHHYDPKNLGHGLLIVSNDDIIKEGAGFQTHPHENMEIVTWVLDGHLEHKDSEGHKGIIYPGLAQRMSAGSGIWHSEMNPDEKKDVHLVQMWVLPDSQNIKPSYQQMDINKELNKGGLVPIASGRNHHSAISIRQKNAILWGGRLKKGETVQIPDAAHVHLTVAKGRVSFDGVGILSAGDSARLTMAGTPKIKATGQGAEVLIWETN